MNNLIFAIWINIVVHFVSTILEFTLIGVNNCLNVDIDCAFFIYTKWCKYHHKLINSPMFSFSLDQAEQ